MTVPPLPLPPESITLRQGPAIVAVDGREHRLSNGTSAPVPRGRVHDFRNDSGGPMAMHLVHAGPSPIRMVAGNPWQDREAE